MADPILVLTIRFLSVVFWKYLRRNTASEMIKMTETLRLDYDLAGITSFPGTLPLSLTFIIPRFTQFARKI